MGGKATRPSLSSSGRRRTGRVIDFSVSMACFVLVSQVPSSVPPLGYGCDGPRPCLIEFEKAMNFRAKPYKKCMGHTSLREQHSKDVRARFNSLHLRDARISLPGLADIFFALRSLTVPIHTPRDEVANRPVDQVGSLDGRCM